MENTINKISNCLKEIHSLSYKLNDKEYWIDKAAKEAGFIPKEGDWISVDITIWHIRISVYHKYTGHGAKESRYWFNGEWFDTPFPEKYPDL